MTSRAALFTDLDNTLYDWVDFYGAAFRAMVHALSRELGTPESILIQDFRKVYQHRGSIEYSYSIEELPSIQGKPPAEIRRLAHIGWQAHRGVRLSRLKPYPGVMETLGWLREREVAVIGISNAPIHLISQRIQQLKLSEFFTGVAGWEGWEVPDHPARFDPFDHEPVDQPRRKSKVRFVWPRPRDRLKPASVAYTDILRATGISAERSWAIGDSLEKDVAPAMAAGMMGIWARYGTKYDQKNMDTILAITQWDSGAVESTYREKGVEPDYKVDSFADLKSILPFGIKQKRLKEFEAV